LSLLSNVFHGPQLPAAEAVRQRLASRLSLLVAALTFSLVGIDLLIGKLWDADSSLTLGLGVAALVGWWALKRWHYGTVAWVLVGCLMVQALASAYFFGSVRTVNIWLVVVAQVAAGTLMSKRALMVTTAVGIALLGLLTWAEAHGLLRNPTGFDVGWRTWISQLACLLAVAVMVYLNRTQMRAAQLAELADTERRTQAQTDRDASQRRFAGIFAASPTPLFVSSERTGQIVDVNPAFERVTGYPSQEVLGRRDGFLWLQDASAAAFAQARRHERRTGWCAITGIGRDGRHVPLLICSDSDEEPDDGMIITALRCRVPGAQDEAQDAGVSTLGRTPSGGQPGG
jgi:PAS domain S-box-containing protein